MPRLTDQGLQKINDLAQHYGVSADAVMTLLRALLNSKGTMAQFDHRERGGAGQWMPGGMTMVGDMFNHGLKAKVDGLCSELPFERITHPENLMQSRGERVNGRPRNRKKSTGLTAGGFIFNSGLSGYFNYQPP